MMPVLRIRLYYAWKINLSLGNDVYSLNDHESSLGESILYCIQRRNFSTNLARVTISFLLFLIYQICMCINDRLQYRFLVS